METKPQNRFRLAPKESSTPTFPVAGPLASTLYLAPSEGPESTDPMLESVAPFTLVHSLGELKSLRLQTSGYDDPELQVLPPSEAQEPEFPVPPVQTAAKSIKFNPVPPAAAKLAPACGPIHPSTPGLNAPRMVASTLRTKLALGPNPNKSAAAEPVPEKASVPEKPAVAEKPATPAAPGIKLKPAAQAAAPAPAKAAPAPAPAKPAPAVQPARPASITIKPSAAPVQEKPAAAAAAPAPAAAASAPASPSVAAKAPAAPAPTAKPAAAPVEKPAEKRIEKPVEKTVEKTAAEKPASEKPAAPERPAAEKPAAEKPKINVRPAQPQPAVKKPQPPPQPAPSRPAIAAREGNAVPAPREERNPQPLPHPLGKPKVQPIRPASVPTHEVPMLGMPNTEMAPLGGFWGKASTPVKGGIVAAAAVVLIAGGSFLFKGGNNTTSAHTNSVTTDAPASAAPLAGSIIGGGGWSPNWGSDSPTNKGKQMSIFRPTLLMADYIIEFNGQVEKKALGWMFRAHDPKNYYVYKLKIVKPGTDPAYALEKFAVVNGKEDVHTQVMLNVPASLDTVWRVRTDVQGKKFTTYINDKLVDYMTDDRIKLGGAGFYNDAGEYGQIRSSRFLHPAGQ